MDLRLVVCLILLPNLRFSSGQRLACSEAQWQCDDGTCITAVWRCDGEGDCLDGSDEMDCNASTDLDCPAGQFPCLDSVGCVDMSARCDGQKQCPTGSDEEDCPATEGCLESEWMCGNHICIPKELHCNGQNDCMDNSDEEDCGKCSVNGLRCPEGKCLSAEQRCDGEVHCSDGSDEPITCGRTCSMYNGGCSHKCTDESWGVRCICPVGHKLSPNGAVCEDLDECASAVPQCAHYCTNTIGSYYCHCREGFKLNGDSTCQALGNATKLLMMQGNSIGLLNVKSKQFTAIKTPVSDPVASTYDIMRGWYYWADSSGSIYKTDGRNTWTTFTGPPGIKGLACDWLNGYLFWTNKKTESIYMQSSDYKSFTALLSKCVSPSELVLLPIERFMFWINKGLGDRVTLERSWMDGSERSTLVVLTAQFAHSLTADVAARRLYWISDSKKSVETVKADGTGRYSFTGLFNKRPALSLAVFEGMFFWVDQKGLWQAPQDQSRPKKFIMKTDLPLLSVFHELQQPKGSSPCAKTRCLLCQLTKNNPAGFTCACPYFKVLLPDGTCKYPQFLYGTATTISLLEFKGKESSETELFSSKEGILSFDVYWYREWLYWANQTGHVQRTKLTLDKTEFISTPLPVCLLSVDQRSGNLFWVSCDLNIIGTTAVSSNYPQQLYHTTKEISNIYLDWLRGGLFWLEEGRLFGMGMMGGKAEELLQIAAGGVGGNVAFDIRAGSLFWNSKRGGLTTLSLLKEKSHQAGRRWNISGSVVAAFEPFLLSISNKVITLWDRRDGSQIQSVSVKGPVFRIVTVLGDVQTVPDTQVCNMPSWMCHQSSICLPQNLLCDGKRDCPDGDDEELCVSACPPEDFMCMDRRNCIPRILLCDGRAHCHDGSDEVDCPTVAAPLSQTNVLKCRSGSVLCRDGMECVLYSHVCDGEADCKDGSDELGCNATQEPISSTKPNKKLPVTKPPPLTLPACLSPSVLCPYFKAYICVSESQFCDGIEDCPDGFDEQNCVERCRLRSDFLCKNHRSCVPKSAVCDGRRHCPDGSDEMDCPNVAQGVPHNELKCRFGSKRCTDGLSCVLMSHVCDGEWDCRDGSDEDGCDTPGIATIAPTTPPCTSPSVLCPGSSICVKPTQMCDGQRDCPDGSDEKCVKRCSSESDFHCKDRRSCVPLSQVCDGRSQCNDGSDELNCPSEVPPAAPNKILRCHFGSKLCQDGLRCVLLSHICDGERDCRDGSDEAGCDGAQSGAVENEPLASPTLTQEVTQPPTMSPCTSPSVLCPGSTICIKHTQMCDGKRDCPDGSDERCIKRCNSHADFRCKDRLRCIPKSQVCDGRSQCTDGSDEVDCQSAVVQAAPKEVLKCRFGSRLCNDRTACVLLSHICDGETDCQDGSDEEACDSESAPGHSMGNELSSKSPELTETTLPPTKPPCTSPSVLCPGSSICIKHTQVCDGKEDCPDGSDEKCIESCPSEMDFLCRDHQRCIPKTKVCDGRSHCNDGSDEVGCQSVAQPESPKILKCRFGSKLCRDGMSCVYPSHICDGEPDCQDGSDEEECDKSLTQSPTPTKEVTQIMTPPPCTSPSVLCPGSSVCVKTTQMCDGTWDCPDGYDEKCVERCPANYFHCKDHRSCVPWNQVCDGRSQCSDGSDEVNCQSAAPPAAQTKVLKCRFGSKLCDDGTSCVLLSHICDGDEDCHDGSDEEGCDDGSLNQSLTPTKEAALIPTNPPCTSPSVLCPGSSICIKPTLMCDGTRDCPDGFDEKCINQCPSDTDFRCNDRQRCIPKTKVCDGRSQCNDGSDEMNCDDGEAAPTTPPKVPKCRFGSKLCRDRMKCVLLSHVCDGEADCQDGSDEEGCDATETGAQSSVDNDYMNESPKPVKHFSRPPTTPLCTSPSVLCPGTSICLKATQICDRRKDCPDGSDEKCVRCPGTDFRCKDRRSCVPKSQVCDGRSHCNDGSDEFNCQSVESRPSQIITLKCRMGSRMCRDGTDCVLFSHVCDGETDCRDGSDEEGCDDGETIESSAPNKQFCSFPSVLCPDSNVCINPSQLCDGIRNCPDGSDENCVKKCADRTDFLCKDRRSCVPRSLVCDGRAHCYDGSDEADCRRVTAPPLESNILKCRRGSKPCKDGQDCVLFNHVCDGEIDCMDGSDEEGCQETCDEGEFQCAHGKMCIPENEVCDGKPQCRDHSDEVDCWQRTKSCEHRCADGKRCIPKKFLCDGEPDCLDGTDELNCNSAPTDFPVVASTSACITPSVLCPGSSQCISQHQLCDGQRDCPDGFDEMECIAQCENPADFLCKDQRKCIPKTQVCDGRTNCPDGSDEKQCQSELTSASPITRPGPLKCRTGFKLCKNGLECIMYSHVCDGEHDCQDGSDEEGCEKQCKPGQFQCSHGRKCIQQEHVCDGQMDCQDHSDELDCSKPIEGCHHLCDNKTRCVPKTFLCDGEKDCTDGSDEDKCGLGACAPDQHQCKSGQCISEAFKCDGYPDCHDHSDEAGCPRAPHCPAQLRCPHSHECLQKEWLCDGEEDCKDGSDENNCNNPPTKCRKYQFQCRGSSLCVPQSWRCDGKEDCENGVDEDKCIQRKCPYHLYQCGSKECLEPRLVCDGITNCIDGSDEGVGCAQRNCSSPSAPACDHRCVSTPKGPRCYCGAGFRLQSSSKSCMDIDECTATPATSCKHLCQNTRGSYSCLCHPGFYLEPDDKSCKTKDEPLLLASVQSELLILGVHSGTLQLLSSADRPVFALDFHWAEQRVYWVSPDHQSIRWADMITRTKGTLTKGMKSDSIAVDWVGKNLYWVDRLVGHILAMKLSSSIMKSQDYTVVLGENLEQTSSLVLIPDKGLMLWSEIGSVPQIERSGMDGSQRKVLVSQDLIWPVSLAYDFLDDRIYWADEKLHCIGSASLDGDDIKILQLTETPSPFSVAIFSDRMFWSDTKRRTVRSADKKTGKNQTVLLKRPGQPFGLKLMHALSQPAVSSPCDNLRCSNLCLLAPAPTKSGALAVNAAVCRCPKGFLLSQDRMTCFLPRESSFILLLSRNKISQIYLRSMRRFGIALKKMPNGRDFNLPGVPEAMSLDINFSELFVFVAYSKHGSVDVLKLTHSLSKPELVLVGHIVKLQDDSVTALAVDWVTSSLYWSSMKRPDIHVTSHLENHTISLLQGPLIRVESIALHPSSGRLCYFAIVIMGSRSQTEIHCAWMDGRNKVVLWKRLSIPISLVFTNDGTRIYWADAGEGIISSIGVDGSAYKEYKTGPNLLVSFTLIENFFFWVTQDKDVSKLWFSDGFQPKQLWFQTNTKVSEMRSYNNETQSGSNHCSNSNGGCIHLCLPYPGGRTCKCARGFYSANDTSCVPLPSCPSGEKSCLDGSMCIENKRFCDGREDCPDQSDEQDCPGSASFGTIVDGDQSPQSSLHQPDTQKTPIVPDEVLASCDLQRCNGHGNCITEGKVAHCHCLQGYTGEFCQNQQRQSHPAIIVVSICLVSAVVVGALIFTKRRWEYMRSRFADKEKLLTNMVIPDEQDSDSEELESPVDVKNLQPIK